MQHRNPKDFWTGIIYVLFGSAAFYIARDYPMGTALKMGPGYFPTILSALLVLIGIISLIRSFARQGSPVDRFAVKGLAIVLGATVLFGLLLRGGGLIVALPMLVVASAAASSRFRWRQALLLGAGLTLACTLIFLKGLGVPIPMVGSWFGR
jgi:putative tricarboxylic transport membrane protein